MRLIIRIGIILAAALLVVAGMLAAEQSDWTQRLVQAGRGSEDRAFQPRPEFGQGDQRPDFSGREHRGDRHNQASLFGFGEVARNFITMMIAVVVVIVGSRVVPFVRRMVESATYSDKETSA